MNNKVSKKTFADNPDVAVFTSRFVLEEGKTITLVTHDSEDGAWQFLSDDQYDNYEDVARIVTLQEIVSLDPTLGELALMPLGYHATRKDKSDNWEVKENKHYNTT